MMHCWTDRYDTSGSDDQTTVEMAEIKRRWPKWPCPEDAWAIVSQYLGEACMLRAGHKGPHQFQPTESIVVHFLPETATTRAERPLGTRGTPGVSDSSLQPRKTHSSTVEGA